MRKIIFLLFPKIKKEIDKLKREKFNLSLAIKIKDEYSTQVVRENRMMSDYILTLEKRLEIYEKVETV